MKILKYILAIIFLIPVISFGRVDTFRTRVQLAARHALYDSNFDHIMIWIDPGKENLLRDAFDKAISLKKFGDTANVVAQDFFLMKVHSTQEEFINSTEYASISMEIEEAFITNSILKLNARLPNNYHSELQRRFNALSVRSEFPPGDIDEGRQFANEYNELIRFIVSHKGVTDYNDKKLNDDNLFSSQPIAFTVLAILIGIIFLLHFIIVHHQRKNRRSIPTRARHTTH